MTYSLDTSAFIRFAKDMPHDVVPSLWAQFDNMVDAKAILISEEVKIELDLGNDWVKQWMGTKSGLLVKSVDVQDTVSDIINNFNLVDPESTTNQADPFVIAVGEDNVASVVANEGKAHPSSPLVKIPDVCTGRGIPYLRHLDFLRRAGVVL